MHYINYFPCLKTISCPSDFKRYLFFTLILFLCPFPFCVYIVVFCVDIVLFQEGLFLLQCFNWQEVLSPRVWGSRISTSSLFTPWNEQYCCRICAILYMIFKKRVFTEALCRPLFTKQAHCKPLFPFQNNA